MAEFDQETGSVGGGGVFADEFFFPFLSFLSLFLRDGKAGVYQCVFVLNNEIQLFSFLSFAREGREGRGGEEAGNRDPERNLPLLTPSFPCPEGQRKKNKKETMGNSQDQIQIQIDIIPDRKEKGQCRQVVFHALRARRHYIQHSNQYRTKAFLNQTEASLTRTSAVELRS